MSTCRVLVVVPVALKLKNAYVLIYICKHTYMYVICVTCADLRTVVVKCCDYLLTKV